MDPGSGAGEAHEGADDSPPVRRSHRRRFDLRRLDPRRLDRRTGAVVITSGIALSLIVAAIAVGSPDRATWLAAPGAGTSSDPEASAPCGGWECDLQARFAATEATAAQAPGHLGIVLRDRVTGQVWRAGAADRPIWTASTIKLAIIADLMVRARAGDVKITGSMRKGFDQMLAYSANRPATNLWPTYGGEAALVRYRAEFGMTGVHFPTSERLWGALKATADDFAALMSYVLERMAAEDRAYIVEAMQTVDEVQQWGVWAAGPALAPGVKAGWNVEKTPEGESHWVLNSVGFVGPQERYVVAMMYELLPGTQVAGHRLGDGLHVVNDVVATLFGAPVPAKIPNPSLLLEPPPA